ncbi:hypothetical protein DAPPUDRAFT_314923 [Daphnia pulex]|uniref:Uncharacterized protein n=1 Tax=Daphnia pulex TaxID=6669 RepID=E9G7Y6_DAPPU|nr:hypothetical protein DAPPUDRAFT_314923 [Daphnia pulex]|eukprot:EFX84577.1 hypothetical protein DAPPUDRAFT_314923 [Daphnia pulex]
MAFSSAMSICLKLVLPSVTFRMMGGKLTGGRYSVILKWALFGGERGVWLPDPLETALERPRGSRHGCPYGRKRVTQHVEILDEEEKRPRLIDFIRSLDPNDKSIVFVGRKLVADPVATFAKFNQIPAQGQSQRGAAGVAQSVGSSVEVEGGMVARAGHAEGEHQ